MENNKNEEGRAGGGKTIKMRREEQEEGKQ